MHVIKSVGVLSCAKIAGAIQAAMGIIFMPFFLLAGLVGAFANTETERVSSLVFVVFAIFFPVFYGGLGFLMGALSAWAYNLVSKWTGGIELELQAPTAAVISPAAAWTRPL
ncbi:MAG: hypothetical protein DMG90_11365 [Acidobacteria bacterium]|nr:MAG: hypothetical protein DMG90_11365 [Acidobacteriota bacterium]PYY09414.1 MAG: hypothetical protein DMG69_10415 [Acidobacteriota bacterium]